MTDEQWWMCVKQVLMEQVALQLPMMMGFKPMAEKFGMEYLTASLPSWYPFSLLGFIDECLYHLGPKLSRHPYFF